MLFRWGLSQRSQNKLSHLPHPNPLTRVATGNFINSYGSVATLTLKEIGSLGLGGSFSLALYSTIKMFASAIILLLSGGVVGEDLGKLFLFPKTGGQQEFVGSKSSLLQIGITGAGAQGFGCFVIFKEENFVKPLEKVGWARGLEFEEEIVVKSVKFLQEDCADVSINGVSTITTVIIICVGVCVVTLVLIGLAVFHFNKYREARRVRPPEIS